jgi:hypothetical protein
MDYYACQVKTELGILSKQTGDDRSQLVWETASGPLDSFLSRVGGSYVVAGADSASEASLSGKFKNHLPIRH